MTVNTMGKTRPASKPYLIVEDPTTGWVYRVLKAYSLDPGARFARWFCEVTGFATDLGDTYVQDVRGIITFRDPVVTDADLPAWLTGAPTRAQQAIIDHVKRLGPTVYVRHQSSPVHVCNLSSAWPVGHPEPVEDPAKVTGPEVGALCLYKASGGNPVVVKVLERSYVWSPGECRHNGGYRRYMDSVVQYRANGTRVVVLDKDLTEIKVGDKLTPASEEVPA